MKVGTNHFPKSSFLSVEKDLKRIAEKLMTNQRLMKLLYYTEKDCLTAPSLKPAEILSMVNKQIKIVPYLPIEMDCPTFVVITMDNFTPNATNPEFRDCTVSFDILCHPDHWNMGDFQLRPYKIAGEIDSMIDGEKLTGIGEMSFAGGNNLVLNDQLMGISIIYRAVHGIEDKID